MSCEHTFAIFLQGAETGHWRKVLADSQAVHVGLNFRALKLPKRPWTIEEHFPHWQEVLVDSGGYGAALDADHDAHHKRYTDWVGANLDAITMVTEYDPPGVSLEWIEERRSEFYSDLPSAKFVPVWHQEYGIPELERLCAIYDRVGLVKPDRDMESKLKSLVATTGVRLHGVGMTRREDMERLPLSSVSSTSWISPTKFGDVQVWSKNRWHWYPAKSQEQARRTHRRDFAEAGFDPGDIEVGDNATISRYTVWAWLQYEQSLANRKTRGRGEDSKIIAIRPGVTPGEGAMEISEAPPTPPAPSTEVVVRREKMSIPGFSTVMAKVENPQVDGPERVPVPVLRESNMRQCDHCHLASRCPAYQPNAECAYEVPVQIRTREQLRGSMMSILETQFTRVQWARMAEEAEGGPPDVATARELELYMNLTRVFKEVESDDSFLRIEVKGSGANGGGLLSSIMSRFMPEDGPQMARAAAQVYDPQRVADFIDAEIVDDEP